MAQEKPLVWVHSDCLSPYGPAYAACPDAPSVFVFDDGLLDRWGYGLKRVAFLYECVLELPCAIRRGDTVGEVLRFAEEQGAGRIVTTETPDPDLCDVMERLRQRLPLEVCTVRPFVQLSGAVNLTRFSRYWKRAQGAAFGG